MAGKGGGESAANRLLSHGRVTYRFSVTPSLSNSVLGLSQATLSRLDLLLLNKSLGLFDLLSFVLESNFSLELLNKDEYSRCRGGFDGGLKLNFFGEPNFIDANFLPSLLRLVFVLLYEVSSPFLFSLIF